MDPEMQKEQSKDDVLQTSLDPWSETDNVLEKIEYVQSSLINLTPLADAKKVDIVQSPESTVKENSTTVLNCEIVETTLKKNPWFSCCFSFVLEGVVSPSVVAAQTHGVAVVQNPNLANLAVEVAVSSAADLSSSALEVNLSYADVDCHSVPEVPVPEVPVLLPAPFADVSVKPANSVVGDAKAKAKSSRVSKAAKAASLAAKAVVQYIQ